MIYLIIISLFLLCINYSTVLSGPFQITLTESTCKSGEYFNILSYKCERCSTYYNVANDAMIAKSYNCTCSDGYIFEYNSGTDSQSCVACSSNTVPSKSQELCLSCPNGYNSTTGKCSACPNGQFLQERDALGILQSTITCVDCGSYAIGSDSSDLYSCKKCPDNSMTVVGSSCQCPTGFTLYNDECIFSTSYSHYLSQYGLDAATKITYRNILERSSVQSREVQSYLLVQDFFPAAVKCSQLRDQKSCNALANYCAASLYDTSNVACRIYADLWSQETTTLYGYEGWKSNLPWIYYFNPTSSNIDDSVILSSRELEAPFHNRINFVFSVFTINGTWLGFREMKDELIICQGSSIDNTRWMWPGYSQRITCNFNVYSLHSKSQQEFYDVYISSGDQLVPIPIRIENMRSNQLVRRFSVYDNSFSKSSSSSQAEVLRFLTNVKVDLRLGGTELVIPLIHLTYSERLSSSLDVPTNPLFETTEDSSLSTPEFTFEAYYTTNFLSHAIAVSCMCVLFVLIGIAVLIYQTVLYIRGRDGFIVNASFIGEFISNFLCNTSNALCVALGAICMFWYWGFKHGKNEFSPLRNEELIPYIIVLVLAFITKAADLGYSLFRQITSDVFFIDWEKSAGKIKSLDELRPDIDPRSRKNGKSDKIDDSQSVKTSKSMDSKASNAPQNIPVSIWRSVFIAREWKLLNNSKVVNFDLTIMVLIMILVGFKVINLGNASPGTGYMGSNEVSSPVLRFWITAMIWILVFFIPYLFNRFIYFRFWYDPVKKFVRQCSESNISVFILYNGNRGYYIHGASGVTADSSMKFFHGIVQVPEEKRSQEEKRIRHLLGDTAPEDHCFEMYLTSESLQKYQDLRNIPRSNEKTQRFSSAREIRFYNFIMWRGQRAPSHTLAKARRRMNIYLRTFVRKIRSNFAGTSAQPTQDPIRQRFITDRLGIPPSMRSSNRDVLITDSSFMLSKILSRGLEIKFFLFNLLLFGILELFIPSTIWSFFIVYVIQKIIMAIRSYIERLNIIRKAFLDERFLV